MTYHVPSIELQRLCIVTTCVCRVWHAYNSIRRQSLSTSILLRQCTVHGLWLSIILFQHSQWIDMLRTLLSFSGFCSALRVAEEEGSFSFLTRSSFVVTFWRWQSSLHQFVTSDLGMGCLGNITLNFVFSCIMRIELGLEHKRYVSEKMVFLKIYRGTCFHEFISFTVFSWPLFTILLCLSDM